MGIPVVTHPFLDRNGNVDVVWRRWLQSLGEVTSLADLQAAVAAIQAQLADMSDGPSITGNASVQVTQNGDNFYLWLVNDQQNPTVGFVYSADENGVKGWHQLAAEFVAYDNSTSGLVADQVQAAIDEMAAAAANSVVPYFVPDGETYSVPQYKQALFTLPIELGVGSSIDLSGSLVEVN